MYVEFIPYVHCYTNTYVLLVHKKCYHVSKFGTIFRKFFKHVSNICYHVSKISKHFLKFQGRFFQLWNFRSLTISQEYNTFIFALVGLSYIEPQTLNLLNMQMDSVPHYLSSQDIKSDTNDTKMLVNDTCKLQTQQERKGRRPQTNKIKINYVSQIYMKLFLAVPSNPWFPPILSHPTKIQK